METKHNEQTKGYLDSEKDFLSNVDYLKSLVNTLKSKSVSDYDSNLIYEAVYADMYVSDLITKVNSPALVATLNDIKLALEIVISEIPDDDVLKARESQDYKNILRNKYKNIEDGSYKEKKAYSVCDNLIKAYMKNKSTTLIAMTLLFLLIITNAPAKLSSMVINFLLPQATVTQEMQIDEKKEVGVDTNDEAELASKIVDVVEEGVKPPLKEDKSTAFSVISLCFSVVITLIFVFQVATVGVDIIYLSFPFVRYLLDSRGNGNYIASVEARGLVEDYDNAALQYKEIKSFDRISRNKHWLTSMLSALESINLADSAVLTSLYNDLGEVKALLDNREALSNNRYYMCIAKIEFLHDRYLTLIDSVAI